MILVAVIRRFGGDLGVNVTVKVGGFLLSPLLNSRIRMRELPFSTRQKCYFQQFFVLKEVGHGRTLPSGGLCC